jgi:hypothetical protein
MSGTNKFLSHSSKEDNLFDGTKNLYVSSVRASTLTAENLNLSGSTIISGNSSIADFTFTDGNIACITGTIDFNNEDLTTTGTINSGNITTSGLLVKNDISLTTGSITSASGTITFGSNDLFTAGTITLLAGLVLDTDTISAVNGEIYLNDLTSIGDVADDNTSLIINRSLTHNYEMWLGGTQTSSNTGASKMFIGTGGNLFIEAITGADILLNNYGGGNVGIGTNNPLDKLSLSGSHTYMRAEGGNNVFGFYGGGNANSGSGASNPWMATLSGTNKAGETISSATYGWLFHNRSSDGNLTLSRRNNSTTDTNVMTFSRSNGNVGIGTINPQYKLDIDNTGGVDEEMRIKGSNPDIYLEGLAGTFRFGTNGQGNGTSGGQGYIYDHSTDQYVMTFQRGSANVGIGTTTPGRKLSLYDGATDYASMNIQGTSANLVIGADSSLGIGYIQPENAGVVSSLILCGAGGNVGIGNIPAVKLDVYSAIRTSVSTSNYTHYSSAYIYHFNSSTGSGIHFANVAIMPTNYAGTLLDNGNDLGSGTYRWKTLYAGTPTINTSDRNMKDNIQDLEENELKVATELSDMIKTFKFKDAIEEKGDKARIHTGFIAQEIEDVFNKYDLDATKYGLLCIDNIYKVNGEKVDEEGNIYTKDSENVEIEKIYGVRMSELLCFMNSGLNNKIRILETNYNNLLEGIEAFKSRIDILEEHNKKIIQKLNELISPDGWFKNSI